MSGRRLVSARFICGGLLLCAWLLFTWAKPAQAEEEAAVRLDPTELVLETGESITLAVRVGNAVTVYGVEVRLRFDPAKAQVLDADPLNPGVQVRPGDFLDADQSFLVAAEADNETGQVIYAATLLAPAPAASGTGTLVEVDLQAIGAGNSELLLDTVILATQEGVALPLSAENGQLTVKAADPDESLLSHLPATSTPAGQLEANTSQKSDLTEDWGGLPVAEASSSEVTKDQILPAIILSITTAILVVAVYFWRRLSVRKN